MAGETTPSEAPVVVAEAVQEARREGAEAAEAAATVQVAAVVEAAAERVERAEEAAQAIADASMQTALGQRLEAIERDTGAWRGELESLRQGQLAMAANLSEATAAMARLTAALILDEALEPSTPEPSSSSPSPEQAEDQEGPKPPKRRHRLI